MCTRRFAARDAMDKLDALCRGSRQETQSSVSPAAASAVVIPVYHETSSSNAIHSKVTSCSGVFKYFII